MVRKEYDSDDVDAIKESMGIEHDGPIKRYEEYLKAQGAKPETPIPERGTISIENEVSAPPLSKEHMEKVYEKHRPTKHETRRQQERAEDRRASKKVNYNDVRKAAISYIKDAPRNTVITYNDIAAAIGYESGWSDCRNDGRFTTEIRSAVKSLNMQWTSVRGVGIVFHDNHEQKKEYQETHRDEPSHEQPKAESESEQKEKKEKEEPYTKAFITSCLGRLRDYLMSAPRGILLPYDEIALAVGYDHKHKGASMTSFKHLLNTAMRDCKIEWVVTHGVGINLNAPNNILKISKVSQNRVKSAIGRSYEVHQNLTRNVKLVPGSSKHTSFENLKRKSIEISVSASKIWHMDNSGE